MKLPATFIAVLFAAAAITPAVAQEKEKTTLEWVSTKSVIMKVAGMDIPVTYTPDGKVSAMDGAVQGTWKIVGETMCSKTNMDPNETCILYPSGKKPGDEFPIMSPQGEVVILINK